MVTNTYGLDLDMIPRVMPEFLKGMAVDVDFSRLYASSPRIRD